MHHSPTFLLLISIPLYYSECLAIAFIKETKYIELAVKESQYFRALFSNWLSTVCATTERHAYPASSSDDAATMRSVSHNIWSDTRLRGGGNAASKVLRSPALS
jgi:hypothetical protein